MRGPSLAVKGGILLVAVFAALKLVLPLFTAPLPMSLIWLYLFLTTIGIVVYGTLSGESTEALLGPIFRFVGGDGLGGAARSARWGVLLLVPVLVGWQTYGGLAPNTQPPAESRTIHPAPPGEFVGLSNPLPNTPENVMMGTGLYAAYCLPCHGPKFNGNGSASDGFNPPPANFADPGTIAMLQESYLFWRIKKGGVGLSVEGHPWKSAMPRWEVELSDDQIWKIIMAEYAGAGQKPRTWE
jgi:mono/diheme cytochrome c family protein